MQLRDPMPTTVLRYIGHSRRMDPDIQSLLWEIKRLRGLVLLMDQLYPVFPRPTCTLGLVHEELARLLTIEPCVIESKARTI